jgi:hypothetical protein
MSTRTSAVSLTAGVTIFAAIIFPHSLGAAPTSPGQSA